MIAENVLELIGETPLLKLNTPADSGSVYIKMERNNPSGSVKDRAVLGMYQYALAAGKINENTVFIEATSGNTGIALAMLGAAFGHRVILAMPETMSVERRNLLSAYDAELELTPGSEGMAGADVRVKELLTEIDNSIQLSQFENGGNPLKHYQTTGQEILQDLSKIDAFVAGIGTGGTISGVSKYLKENLEAVLTIGVEPTESPMITNGTKGPHKIQGIGAGFIPENYHSQYVDQVRTISSDDAFTQVRDIMKSDGLFAGISAGANIAIAKQVALELGEGKVVVTVLPDDGSKYISMGVFN